MSIAGAGQATWISFWVVGVHRELGSQAFERCFYRNVSWGFRQGVCLALADYPFGMIIAFVSQPVFGVLSKALSMRFWGTFWRCFGSVKVGQGAWDGWDPEGVAIVKQGAKLKSFGLEIGYDTRWFRTDLFHGFGEMIRDHKGASWMQAGQASGFLYMCAHCQRFYDYDFKKIDIPFAMIITSGIWPLHANTNFSLYFHKFESQEASRNMLLLGRYS